MASLLPRSDERHRDPVAAVARAMGRVPHDALLAVGKRDGGDQRRGQLAMAKEIIEDVGGHLGRSAVTIFDEDVDDSRAGSDGAGNAEIVGMAAETAGTPALAVGIAVAAKPDIDCVTRRRLRALVRARARRHPRRTDECGGCEVHATSMRVAG